MFRVKGFVGCKVIRNGGCGFAKHIGHNRIQCHIADGERILETIFLTAFHRDQLIAVAGKLAKNADIQVWDETAFYKTNTKQIPDPFRIFRNEAGCCTLTVDSLVYGKGRKPALFILGHNENNQLIKLRWYEKKDFVGISPRSSKHARKGAKWLVGCVAAKDGAMDLLMSIPLECIYSHTIDTIDLSVATSSPPKFSNEKCE